MRLAQRIFNAFEGVGMAVDSIRSNKVRAALTIMGVAIGVFVVVAMSSVVRGINESFARDLEVVLHLSPANRRIPGLRRL
jgi:putative ABC transport system permease protein